LAGLLEAVARDMGFRYYALAHHDDLRVLRPDRVDLRDYPPAIIDHLVSQHRYRRDPVIRGSIFAGGAFLWSDLPDIITLDRHDRASLERGAREGLNEGITVPYLRLGERMGSCTFAGMRRPEGAQDCLGAAQMVGIFSFQAARRLLGVEPVIAARPPRLHPRPRDCVILAGRGYSNKEIARALALTPRTVDGYLTEARHLFGAQADPRAVQAVAVRVAVERPGDRGLGQRCERRLRGEEAEGLTAKFEGVARSRTQTASA